MSDNYLVEYCVVITLLAVIIGVVINYYSLSKKNTLATDQIVVETAAPEYNCNEDLFIENSGIFSIFHD